MTRAGRKVRPEITTSAYVLAALLLPGVTARTQPGAARITTTDYVVGEGTREIAVSGVGPVVERDSVGTVFRWPDLREPGRYRLQFRARFADPYVAAVAVRTPGPYGLPTDARPTTYLSDAPDVWKDLSIDFTVEPGAAVAPELVYPYIYRRVTRAAEATRLQILKSSLRLKKLPGTVVLSWARPSKLRYRLNERPAMECRLVNTTERPQTVQLTPVLLSEDGYPKSGKAISVKVSPRQVLPAVVGFPLSQEGAYRVNVEVRQQNQLLDVQGDVVCASDDAWRFWISGSETNPRVPMTHGLGTLTEAEQVGANPVRWAEFTRAVDLGVQAMRRDYVTGNEMFSWAYEDAVGLVPPSDKPYIAGQSGYRILPRAVRYISQQLKQQGIVSSAYVNSEPFGWTGFEVFRQHPEWFLVRGSGPPATNFNVALLESYYRGDLPAGGDYPVIVPEWAARSRGVRYIDFHVDQLRKSAAMFGWDAYRYDAGPLPDEWFPFVQRKLAALNPPVAIGNNLGIIVLGEEASPRWKTFCSNGALMMEEAANRPFGQPDQHGALRDYRDWMRYVRRGAQLTRSNGGNYLHICATGSWLMPTVGYALSAHPYMYSVYKNPFGDNERFMVGYGYGLWDGATRLMDKPGRFLSVKSQNLLWWEMFVAERPRGVGRREIWVPLINPPHSEVPDSPNRGPAENVVIGFTPRSGEAVTAYLLTPEPVARRISLPVRRKGGRVEVTLPRFWAWVNVIFDCRQPTTRRRGG